MTNTGPVHLVKIRNPWGNFEWDGHWSDKSPLWTPQLRQLHGVSQADDGVFYMSLADFKTHFNDIQICYVEDTFKYSSLKARSTSRNGVYFKLRVNRESQYYFSVNQESKRKFPKNSGYAYSPVKMLLAQIDARGEYIPIGGAFKADMEVWCGSRLAPGEYILYTKISWIRAGGFEFSLSSYGEEEVVMETINKSALNNFRRQFFTKFALQRNKVQDTGQFLRYTEVSDFGFAYWYYVNCSASTIAVSYTHLTLPTIYSV
eukprot:TRINITY_DN4884_c0_g2_i3.p1 TRINITY_DN4884_c0_g2~~TRINITY_DN4884_c0_g2_i3.p1  ORF type:complete len:260 (+),score=27.45 TRINITY_DN4884_c0_g2_i3:175-954(+)